MRHHPGAFGGSYPERLPLLPSHRPAGLSPQPFLSLLVNSDLLGQRKHHLQVPLGLEQQRAQTDVQRVGAGHGDVVGSGLGRIHAEPAERQGSSCPLAHFHTRS